MKGLYYKIWADLITGIQKNPEHKNDWRYYSMFLMIKGKLKNSFHPNEFRFAIISSHFKIRYNI